MDKVSVMYFKNIVFTSCWGCIFIKDSLCILFSVSKGCQCTHLLFIKYFRPSSGFIFFFFFLSNPANCVNTREKCLIWEQTKIFSQWLDAHILNPVFPLHCLIWHKNKQKHMVIKVREKNMQNKKEGKKMKKMEGDSRI